MPKRTLSIAGSLADAAPAPMPMPTPARPTTLAAGAEMVAAQEGLTQVSFHLPFPVSVDNGRTLSLPIVDSCGAGRTVRALPAARSTRATP